MVNIHRLTDLKKSLQVINSTSCVIIAGATDIMVDYNNVNNLSHLKYKEVIAIDLIDELKQIKIVDKEIPNFKGSNNYLQIGSMVTLSELEEHPEVPDLMKQLIPQMAAPAIRNRATIGGNICNASPAADTLPALYVLDALVVLSSCLGERILPIEEFITGPGKTVLQSNELLSRVLIPQNQTTMHFYHKVGTRSANALTKLSVAGIAKIGKSCGNGMMLLDWRIAFGAVGPTVVRDRKLEAEMVNQPLSDLLDPALVSPVIQRYKQIITPIDDQRSTAEYRQHTAINLMTRWIGQLGLMK